MRNKIKKASEGSNYSNLIVYLHINGHTFSLYSRHNTDLYMRYINRKDINIDFSSAETVDDIQVLYDKFVKKFKNYPTIEQIEAAMKKYELALQNYDDAAFSELLAQYIALDLGGTDCSDERYEQIVEYLKKVLEAFANGKDINNVKEKLSALKKLFYEDPLRSVKKFLNSYNLHYKISSNKIVLDVLKKLPKTRITDNGYCKVALDYKKFFEENFSKTMKIEAKERDKVSILLFENKIAVDSLRTFKLLAGQRVYQLKKKKIKAKEKSFKNAKRKIDQKMGVAKKRLANINGQIDPVARSIAKIRRKMVER